MTAQYEGNFVEVVMRVNLKSFDVDDDVMRHSSKRPYDEWDDLTSLDSKPSFISNYRSLTDNKNHQKRVIFRLYSDIHRGQLSLVNCKMCFGSSCIS